MRKRLLTGSGPERFRGRLKIFFIIIVRLGSRPSQSNEYEKFGETAKRPSGPAWRALPRSICLPRRSFQRKRVLICLHLWLNCFWFCRN